MGFRIIQARFISCALYFSYYISFIADHQALDPGGWGPLLQSIFQWSGFWGFRNSLLSGSFFKAKGSLDWLPLHQTWMLLFPLLYFLVGKPCCSPRLCFICLPGVAAEKCCYPLWLQSEKENSQSSTSPSRLVETILILLVPGFKVRFAFYGGDGPSHSACLNGPAFEPGGQLTTLTSSHFNLSGQVALPALVRGGCWPFEWSTRQGWGNIWSSSKGMSLKHEDWTDCDPTGRGKQKRPLENWLGGGSRQLLIPLASGVFRVSYPFERERIRVEGNKIGLKLEEQGVIFI